MKKTEIEFRTLKLKSKDPFPILLHGYLQQQLIALKKYQPIARAGLDPEGVHQMRIAIRRIRTMLNVFTEMFDAEVCGSLDGNLRRLAKQLGIARDADVCEAQIMRFNTVLSPLAIKEAGPYADHLRSTVFRAYTKLNQFFNSEDYSTLVTDLEQFVSAIPYGEAMQAFAERSIAHCAKIYVWQSLQKTMQLGDRLSSHSSSRKVHKLRIQAKRLRYLLDFFSLVQKKKWRAPIRKLKSLQEILGEHQDAVTASSRLQGYAASLIEGPANRHLLLAIDRLLLVEENRIARQRRKLPPAWLQVKEAFN